MANYEKLIPHILKWECGIIANGRTNEKLFEEAREKGVIIDAYDSGGATMCGITLNAYKDYCRRKGYPVPTVERLANIKFTEWSNVLKQMFWDKWKADGIISQSVAEVLVDWTWCSGSYGIKIPQSKLGVSIDSIVGEKTLLALNALCNKDGAKNVFDMLVRERKEYIERICKSKPENKRFKDGWLNRVSDMKFKS